MRLAFFSDAHARLPAFDRIARGTNADVIVCGHVLEPYDKAVGKVRIINDGSAVTPEVGDPRSCWMLLDPSRAVGFHRVEYGVERTAQAISASELPHEFAAQVREVRGDRPLEARA